MVDLENRSIEPKTIDSLLSGFCHYVKFRVKVSIGFRVRVMVGFMVRVSGQVLGWLTKKLFTCLSTSLL